MDFLSNLFPLRAKNTQNDQRDLRANDVEYNLKFNYFANEIKTSRYTWYNFIFLNLWEQFHRVVNIYFVVLLILQYIPQISSLNPTTTLIPIVIVLSITAIKDAVDDVKRHTSDRSVNNRSVCILRDGKLEKDKWMNIAVGDIIKLHDGQAVTADVLLLSSSEEHNLVYIETAELDGETNLKVRQGLPQTGKMQDNLKELSDFRGKVVCEAPNNHLHKFQGNLYTNNETISLDNENILLRGCLVRNTQWCFGLVVFAGRDTKLMQNTGKTILKRTSIERLMNRLVWLIFCLLLCMALVTAIGNGIWEAMFGVKFQVYLPWPSYIPNPEMSGFLTFWSYIIILNTVVPISLYVSIEFIRVGLSLFINWDRKMYYEKKNLPAVARTTTLNEELGQIEYIFSDKTGTLTQNVMEFNKCSVRAKCYGDYFDENGAIIYTDENTPTVDLSYNKYAESGFNFYDERLINAIKNEDDDCASFFRLIAICHTVMPDEDGDGKLIYQAQSPDEGALVAAARNFGYVFISRSFNTITISEMGKVIEYEVLAILDFDNVRKRMSVIVKDPEGKITLYCKGADSVILERLQAGQSEELITKTKEHLDEFACSGLRTLCLGQKQIDQEAYNVWMAAHHQASTSLEDREGQLSLVYEEIERDLVLLGATAIEDKLQDGVPETIANLSRANIKIWVLTGDKQETAVNIGYSCNMLTDEMANVFVINGLTEEEVEKEIAEANKEITQSNSKQTPTSSRDEFQVSMQNGNNSITIQHTNTNIYGLVINGHSLSHALTPSLRLKFLELASMCNAVICCRVTPLQKAMVVELVKKNKKVVTLAIGDGANDVSMIKAAHIGVGISGEEGTQAVLSSDFSFGQFRYLERLILVHGRWSYTRMCKFFGYFFYKNFAFTIVHFWYAFFNGLTAQDLNDVYCIKYPRLYLPGQTNQLFNVKIFFKSIMRGILTSLVLFFVSYGAFYTGMGSDGLDATDRQTVSTVISTALIMVVTLQVGLDTSYWTPVNHFFIWGSIGIYFLFTFALHSNGLYNIFPSQFPFVGVAQNAFALPSLWFTVLLITTICILPVVAIRFVSSTLWPTYTQKILKLQLEDKKKKKKKLRGGESLFNIKDHLASRFKLRRQSSRPKSGYAFSHERGFGELITTGRMSMRRKNLPPKEEPSPESKGADSNVVAEDSTPNPTPAESYKKIEV